MHTDSTQVRPAAAQVADAERHARRELAACYPLADRMGWSDIIPGHITHRVPGKPGHHLINPCLASLRVRCTRPDSVVREAPSSPAVVACRRKIQPQGA